MDKPLTLSFVVPIYGVERYIEKFATSLLSQTYPHVEFVFVNDGTKDRSMEILNNLIETKFAHLKERIVIYNQENQGLPAARKSGIERATGEYVLFADSDDWLEVDAAQKIMAEAGRSGADIIYFDIVKEYGTKQSIKREREYTAQSKEQWIENIFNYRSHGYTVTKCFRRRLYTDNTIYTPKLGMHEDIYLMSQIIYYAQSIVHLPEVLYHYRKDNEAAMCSDLRHKRHIASSCNLLDLYYNYRNSLATSPIRRVADGIVLRAGWHALIHNTDLFGEFPWLKEAILKSKLSTRYRTPLLFQAIVKLYARFK